MVFHLWKTGLSKNASLEEIPPGQEPCLSTKSHFSKQPVPAFSSLPPFTGFYLNDKTMTELHTPMWGEELESCIWTVQKREAGG